MAGYGSKVRRMNWKARDKEAKRRKKKRKNPGGSDSGMALLLLGALGLGIYFWTRGTPSTNGWMN